MEKIKRLTFVSIRQATRTDHRRLNAAARAFIRKRYCLAQIIRDEFNGEISPETIELAIDSASEYWRYFRRFVPTTNRGHLRQWKRCVRRALKHNRANEITGNRVGYYL